MKGNPGKSNPKVQKPKAMEMLPRPDLLQSAAQFWGAKTQGSSRSALSLPFLTTEQLAAASPACHAGLTRNQSPQVLPPQTSSLLCSLAAQGSARGGGRAWTVHLAALRVSARRCWSRSARRLQHVGPTECVQRQPALLGNEGSSGDGGKSTWAEAVEATAKGALISAPTRTLKNGAVPQREKGHDLACS